MPMIAVARELASRGHHCVFVGVRSGLEARLVPEAGFPIEWIRVSGIQRTGILRLPAAAAQLAVGIAQMWSRLGALRPSAVFSLGGYVAAPPVIAALLRRIPVIAMEPNAVPGLVTRRTARWIRRGLVSFEETLAWFPQGRAEVCGVPVRAEFFEASGQAEPGVFRILVTGGSQGSRTLNRAARESWPLFAASGRKIRFTLQAGRSDAESLRAEFAATRLDGSVCDFIPGMAGAMASADLVVSRAGAVTIAELCAAGKPSILVPFPFAADDHQTKNAEAMQAAGASVAVRDSDMSGEKLFQVVAALMDDPETLAGMARAARRRARPDAAARAAAALEEFSVNPVTQNA
jgi:UDP-N-acetylglucosamine--N-acetylmuramyl-(pentapeptide) pyrophosphoryl-undecaprenol N-acetylglucosamine transferase